VALSRKPGKRQIEFYYDCEKKGGAFLNNERRLPDNTSYKFAVNDENGQKESIPGAVIEYCL
jgi:hypothetical protein